MDLQNALAPDDIGVRNDDLAVKPAGTQECGVEHVGAVGGGNEDDAFIGLEPVHFDEQLVERLLALVIPAAEARAAMTTDSVDFVDKDVAGRVLLGLFEHITDAACADADEHFDKVRAGNGEERHIGFARNGACQ